MGGASFAITSPLEPYNNYRADDGMIQAKTPMPALTAKQTALIMAAHAAHSAVSQFRCGGPATTANVAAAHMALEATATNEDMHRFLRMKNFSGVVDPRWTAAEVCKLARLQDTAHARWMAAVQRGDWGHAREADNDHQLAHIMMGMKDPNLRILLSCGQYIFNCGVKTEAQILATL